VTTWHPLSDMLTLTSLVSSLLCLIIISFYRETKLKYSNCFFIFRVFPCSLPFLVMELRGQTRRFPLTAGAHEHMLRLMQQKLMFGMLHCIDLIMVLRECKNSK
jgi:hypothetical protein